MLFKLTFDLNTIHSIIWACQPVILADSINSSLINVGVK